MASSRLDERGDDERRVGKRKKSVQFSPLSEEFLFSSQNQSSVSGFSDSEFDVLNRVSHKIRRLNPSRSHLTDPILTENQSSKIEVPTKIHDGIFQHRSGAAETDPNTKTLPFPEFWWCQPTKLVSLDSLLLDSRLTQGQHCAENPSSQEPTCSFAVA